MDPLFQGILHAALQAGCSDIHLRAGQPPYLRAGGRVVRLDLPPLTAEHIANAIAATSAAPLPAGGDAHEYSFEQQGVARYRATAFLTGGVWSLSLRTIPLTIPSFADLRLPAVVKALATPRPGLLLVTGPTGAGKSTTAAAVLRGMATQGGLHVVTIEDPVEYRIPSGDCCITQRELRHDARDPRAALEDALRMDPDVIFIGEIRDESAFDVAIHAAETGICVLATFHTQSAVHTVGRATAMTRPENQATLRERFADALRGIICQRLLPRRNAPTQRVLATEVLVNNYATKDALRDPARHKTLPSILERSTDQGMHTFDQSLTGLVTSGLVDVDVAAAVSSSPANFRRHLQLSGVPIQ